MTWNFIKLNKITKMTKNEEIIRMKRNEKIKKEIKWQEIKVKGKVYGAEEK